MGWIRAAASISACALLGCSGSTEPRSTNVDLARAVWLANHPQQYSFEVATTSSWFPKSGYTRIQVVDGQAVAATDTAGNPILNVTVTIDSIWDQVIAARARGELNSAVFSPQGVPIDADMGPWEVDGGYRYSVRHFVRIR